MFNYLYFLLKRFIVRKKFNRVLPYADYLISRKTKAEYCGFGKGSTVYDSCLILGNVSVGKNCWIGPFTILDGSGGSLRIGDNCNISAGVHLYTHDTVDRVIYNDEVRKSTVEIGNNVYIGPNSIVQKGVKIGDFCIIGALSFVNKDIPDRSKALGSPIQIFPLSNEKEK